MVRFSTAMALFSVQQLQTVVDLPADSKTAMKKMRDSLESVTNAIATQLDDAKRPAVDSFSTLAGKTFNAFDVPSLSPSRIVETATEVVRKAADVMSDAFSKASQASCESCDEPVQATTL
ncbi:MAG TPA: hypothetical protein VG456_14865 [Candidatus Sulfopaludibacter sp.]|jgi:hypothetical protein|nr:hypothetical protein [Candidatus Sulfopaludibacter sp.]